LIAFFACNGDDEKFDYTFPGNPPASIEHVVDIMELNYEEKKELIYNGQVFGISVVDLEDNMDIITTESDGSITAYIRMATETSDTILTVWSNSIGSYYMDGRDETLAIQDLLESFIIHSCNPKMDDETCFKGQFYYMFGRGKMIENTPLSIYLTKAYCKLQHNQEENKSIYKFIFIITD
jgi:hypothetical protein